MAQRKEYSNPYRSLEAIWTVLRTCASKDRPLTVGDIHAHLKRLEDSPSRATVDRLLPRESELMETLYPGVLQSAGRLNVVGSYADGDTIHIVVETPEGNELAQGSTLEYTKVPFKAPSYSAIDKMLKSGVLLELKSFPFRLRCLAKTSGKGAKPKYIPYEDWEDSLTPEQAEKNNAPRYYYLENFLSDSEWRIFSDLVRVYPFITEKQTGKFLTALGALRGKRVPSVPNRYAYKRGNPQLFEHIRRLDRAIRAKRKVRLTYGEYRLVQKGGKWVPELRQRQKNGVLDVAPHALMWSNGNYYLVCLHQGMMNLRVDRILDVAPLPDSFTPDPEFDPALYRDKCPVMHPGKSEFIRMRCRASMLNTLIDFFGSLPQYATPDPNGDVEVTMSIAPSGVKLFALQYADGVEVLEPRHLREEIKASLAQAVKQYKK